MKLALQTAAILTGVNLRSAEKVIRRHPLFEDEIHIEEELINLEESFKSHAMAQETLRAYPVQYSHMIDEQRQILEHCFGLIVRMIQGKELPRSYHDHDIAYAVMRLVRLLVDRAEREDREINRRMIVHLKPFMSLRQRLKYSDVSIVPNIKLLYQLIVRKLLMLRSVDS